MKNVGDLYKKFRPNRFIAVQHDTIAKGTDKTAAIQPAVLHGPQPDWLRIISFAVPGVEV